MSEVTSAAQPTPSGRGRMSTARLLMYLGILLLVLLVCLRLVPEIMLRQQLAALEAKGYPTTLEGFNRIHPPITGPNRVDLYREAIDLMVRPENVLSRLIINPFYRSLEQLEEDSGSALVESGFPHHDSDGNALKREAFPYLPADIVFSGGMVDRVTDFFPEHRFLPFYRDGFAFDAPGLGRPWTEVTIERVRQVVAANQPATDLALAARFIPEADWEVGWSKWDVDLSHVGQSRSLASELQRYVHLALIDEEIETALSGIEAIKALSNALRNDFSIFGRLAEWSLRGMTFDLAESMINSVDLDEQAYRRLVDLMQVPDSRAGFDRVAAFETVRWLQVLNAAPFLGVSSWENRFFRMAGVRSLQKAESVRLMFPVIELAGQMPSHFHEVPSSLFDAPTGLEWFYEHVHKQDYFLASFRFGFSIEGRARAALTAMAIDRFWLAEGRLPDRLEELVPEYLDEVPISPFSGLPMKLVHFDGGCLVYFVDDQATDGGGFAIRNDGVVVKKRRHTGTLILRR